MKWSDWEVPFAERWHCPDTLRGLCGRGSLALEASLVAILFFVIFGWSKFREWIGAAYYG